MNQRISDPGSDGRIAVAGIASASDNAAAAVPAQPGHGTRAGVRRPAAAGSAVRLLLLCLTAAGGVLIAAGIRRTPADPTAPLVLTRGCSAAEAGGRSIRLATFNIRGGKGRDGRRDLKRTAASLRGFDFIALQEVYGGGVLGGDDQARVLGRHLRMDSLFAAAEERWWRGHFGVGLLSRLVLKGHLRVPLPGTQDCRFRTGLLTSLDCGGTPVRILAVSIDDRVDRERQLSEVIHLFHSLKPPAVLMGDLNVELSDPLLRELVNSPDVSAVGEEWANRAALRGVDWIIARGLRVVRSGCRDDGASDHAVVWAELALPQGASR